MFKNLLQLYALVVCLINSVVLLCLTGWTLNSVMELVIPQYKHYSTMIRYSSDEHFVRHYESAYSYDDDKLKEFQKLTPEKITKNRIAEKANFLDTTRGNAIEELIKALQWLLVSAFFFLTHWNLYKRSTK